MDESLYAYPETERPWLRVNFVATIDGSAQDGDGVSGSLGGEPDEQAFSLMRSLCDAVVVSAGTARAEGYGPIDDGVLVVVTRSLELPAALRTSGVRVLTCASADTDGIARLERDGVEVLVAGTDDVDWSAALDLFADRGWRRLLCEGGPSLLGTLVDADLVDEVCLTVAPALFAGGGSRIAVSEHPTHRPMRLGHAVDVDGVLLTRWVRDRTADSA